MKQLYKLCQAAALCLAVTLLATGFVHAQKRTMTAYPSTKIDNFIGGFYTSLPASYSTSGTKTYPLLICNHGVGEIGDGSASALPNVLKNGPMKQINEQFIQGKNANFPDPVVVNGKSFEFIVVQPQLNQWPSFADEGTAMNDLIAYCESHYRIDPSKVYMTGLSMGGGVTWDYASSAFVNKLAAIVPVAGAASFSAGGVYQMVKYHLPVWATHNQSDGTVPTVQTTSWIQQLNMAGISPTALMTLFPDSGHGGWVKTYGDVNQPGCLNSAGQNIYQWMLQYKRSGDNVIIDNGGTTTPAPPTVNAGSTQTITLPTSSVTLSGSATTTGTISAYQWSQVSGPNTAAFSNAKAASTSATGLIQGTYVFKLTATDNASQSSSAQVTITVNAAPVASVTVNAGSDLTITLPTNSTKITGAATVQNTTVSSTAWQQVSGPNTATIANSGTITPTVSGLVAGAYVFSVTVNTAAGKTATDQMTLTVKPAATIVFTVSAGSDLTITLPTNSTKITGAATVQNTTVSSTAWKQVSGPNTATIANGGTITPTMSGLVAGSYVFQVTITSASGTTATDQVTVIVKPASVFTVNAGADLTITLPTSSATITGTTSITGETLSSSKWTQVSGPNTATIANSGTISPTVSGLIAGTYVFQITITSASGKTATDQMTLTVKPAAVVSVFTVDAGSNQTVVLPTSGVKLTATTNIQGETLSSIAWAQVSGSSKATITNGTTLTPTISNVIGGTYVFSVTITSASGKTATDQVLIQFNTVPSVFTASAGSNFSITLPTNSTTINGSATVQSEVLATCKWTEVSGPNTATISNSGTAKPTVSGLVAGSYVFQMTITSISGKTASSQMTLTVNPASSVNTTFTVNAGPDVFITLPTNSWKIIGTCTVSGVSIATCKWTQISGPNTAVISGGGSISPVAGSLVAGTYTFQVSVTSTTGLVVSDQMQLTVATSTARAATPDHTDSSLSTADLKLYPNPVQLGQQVVVEGQGVPTGNVKISIFDISGRQAKQVVIDHQSGSYFRQPVSIDGAFARGVYILTLSVDNQKPRQFKFVVQ